MAVALTSYAAAAFRSKFVAWERKQGKKVCLSSFHCGSCCEEEAARLALKHILQRCWVGHGLLLGMRGMLQKLRKLHVWHQTG